MTQSNIGRTKRHLAMRVHEHHSGNSGKSAICKHISSCKGCHSCSINNFYASAQANIDAEAKIKEVMHFFKYNSKLNNQIYPCGSSFF